MKRMRNLRILLIGALLFALIALAMWSVLNPPRYESNAQLLIVRKFDDADWKKRYQFAGMSEQNGNQVEYFVIDGEVQPVSLQSFCTFKHHRVHQGGNYFAYFFDDKEFAKAPHNFVDGLPVYDETALTHLKATYVHGVLSIPDLKRDEPAVENP